MSQHPLRISLFDVLASPRAEARTESGFPDYHPHYFLLMQILKVCHSWWVDWALRLLLTECVILRENNLISSVWTGRAPVTRSR